MRLPLAGRSTISNHWSTETGLCGPVINLPGMTGLMPQGASQAMLLCWRFYSEPSAHRFWRSSRLRPLLRVAKKKKQGYGTDVTIALHGL